MPNFTEVKWCAFFTNVVLTMYQWTQVGSKSTISFPSPTLFMYRDSVRYSRKNGFNTPNDNVQTGKSSFFFSVTVESYSLDFHIYTFFQVTFFPQKVLFSFRFPGVSYCPGEWLKYYFNVLLKVLIMSMLKNFYKLIPNGKL